MANNYFDFIGQNAGEEKKETPQQTQAMANVTVRCDADCFLLCDGEYLYIQLGAGKMAKIQVPIGQHLLEFLYTEDPDIKIEKEVDFPESGKSYLVIIKGLKELVDGAEAEAQAKVAEAEAKKKAEEEAKRKAKEEEAKRKAEEEDRRKAEEEARRKAEEELRIRELQTKPYAVLSNNNATLTFYYDHLKSDRNGMNIEDKKWKEHRNDIVTVVFDKSFANCHNICSTSHWFNEFNYLTSVVGLNNLNTSKVTDMSYMFFRCMYLQSLDLSRFDTSKVTNMSYMFESCCHLRSLDLSRFDTRNVTNMSSMFCCCSLQSLDLSSFDTSKVTDMSSMFAECRFLQSLDLSSFDTSKVTTMRAMFDGCRSLRSLDLSNFDTSKVTDMSSMFFECKSLQLLDLSSFDTSKVTTMRAMFDYCPIKKKFNKK